MLPQGLVKPCLTMASFKKCIALNRRTCSKELSHSQVRFSKELTANEGIEEHLSHVVDHKHLKNAALDGQSSLQNLQTQSTAKHGHVDFSRQDNQTGCSILVRPLALLIFHQKVQYSAGVTGTPGYFDLSKAVLRIARDPLHFLKAQYRYRHR